MPPSNMRPQARPNAQAIIDYGRCPCSGFYERKFVEVRLNVQGKAMVLTGVPQGTCQVCGSRVYKADVLARIEAVMKNERYVK